MADFLLSVGIDVGLSYSQMQKDISSLVSQLNSNPIKIKAELDKASVSNMRSQIEALTKATASTKAVNVGINNTGNAKGVASDMTNIARNAKTAEASARAMNAEINKTAVIAKNTTQYYTYLKQINTLLTQVTHSQERWTAAKNGKSSAAYNSLGIYADELRSLQQQLQTGKMSAAEFQKAMASIRSGVAGASGAIKTAGEATQSWSDRVSSLSSKFGTWLSITQVIMAGVRAIKAMTGNVIELDTAMTELRKVTDETDAAYEQFLTRASSRAKQLGATISDTVRASADFARLGYDIEDSEMLSDAAIIYKNVGEIESIDTASQSIISTMQAFGVLPEEAMNIVDKFNEVGNKYAISSEGIGDALLRSASAMHAAGNTLDETIALATAANTVVQDPNKVGTALKTVSMFLRAAKTEAEDAGESTEGMANSVSELRDEILALTGSKVDIQLDDNTFKSTYQILKELSSVWDELTDITQANILELIGGKRNSNVVSALLENFSTAERVVETSANSAGSAVAENEKVLESLQGKLNILKATFEDFSKLFINEGFLGGAITGLTKLLEALNILTDIAGPLPATIGAITLALSAFGKNSGIFSMSGKHLQVFGKNIKQVVSDFKSLKQISTGAGVNSIFSSPESNQSLIALQNFSKAIDSGVPKVQAYKQHISGMGEATRKAAVQIASGSKSVNDLGKSAKASGIAAKAAAVGVTALNIAMNMLITMGISAVIQGIITGLDNLIHYEEKAAEKSKEIAQSSRDAAQKQAEQTDSLSSLIVKYKELAENDVQDASTRDEILDIQNQIVDLVGDEASGIDLVNGKLDEQIAKLKEINDIEMGQTVSDYRKAYVDAAKAVKDVGYQKGNWINDLTNFSDDITFDFWGESSERSKGVKIIDQLWKEKGYGQAYIEEQVYDLIGLASDTFVALDFKEGMSIQARIKAIDEAIAALEANEEVDYTNTKLWSNLVDIRAELGGKDSEYAKQVQTASEFLNKLTQSKIGTGSDINTYENYINYRQKLIDEIADDTTIKQAIQDGVLNNDQITSMVDGYLGTLEKYDGYYTQWSNKIKDNTESNIKSVKDSFAKSFDSDDKITEFNNWIDNISDEDKEIVYDISIDNDTASWTLDEWRSQLRELKGDTSALDVLKAKIDAINDVKSGKIKFDIESETSGVEGLQSAVKSSVSATGVTTDLIKQITDRYGKLSGFNASELFEKTANGIHLNTDALRELESEYKVVNDTYLDTALEEQVNKYNELTEKISSCTDMQERAKLISEQNQLGAQIEETAILASQYEGLTSAYQNWINAQSMGEEGDMYDNLASNLENIKKLYDEGLVGTNEFRAATQLMTNYDISNWGIEDIIKAYENGYPLMKRYFKEGQDGCIAFLSDVSKLNSEWAHMNEDGSWDINFGAGNDQEVADKLGISVEAVQSIMRKLSDYGFDIDLDSVLSDLGLLEDKFTQANEKLKELRETKIDFNFNSTNIDDVNKQIGEATNLLSRFKNDDGTVNLSLDGAEEVQLILAALIQRKQELNKPAIMSVNTSTAQTDISNVIASLKEFQTNYNKLEVDTAIGVDTTEAQTNVNNALATVSEASPEILASLGIDTTSAETLAASINALTPEVMVKAGLDATLIENYQASEHNASGTVKWDNDTLLVDNWIQQAHNANGTIKWGNDTTKVKTRFEATGTIKWFGGGGARGTAFKDGSWGTKRSGIALGGELGQELIVRDGRFFTIGDYGAEFFTYKKDDIIFNAEQTKQIFEKGKITSGNRRGVALADGTAFSSGTGRFYQSGKLITTTYIAPTDTSPTPTADNTKPKTETNEESEFERQYKYHQHLLNMDKESLQDYLDWLVVAYKEAYNTNQIELDDFYKYAEEVYDKSQKLFDDSINDSEHQISMWENQGGHEQDIITEYKTMQEAVHEQAEYYRSLGLDDNNENIQKLQKQWWDYQNNINEITADGYENRRKQMENAVDVVNAQMENAVASRDYSAVSNYTSDIIGYYKAMQENVHEQAEYYRSLGYDDTSDEVSELIKLWWKYQDGIKSAVESGYDALVESAINVVDTIQNVYDTLKSSADEYAETGNIPIDLLKSMSEIGIEYMSYLEDENGMLVINKDRINDVIVARTKQLAVDTAMSYVEKLRLALSNGNVNELNRLVYATENASNATWDLVYSNLALLDLSDEQYSQALGNINKLRSISDTAAKSIYSENTEERSKALEDTKDALDTILDLTMELIEYEVDQQVEALENQINKYKEIIDLKKEALNETKKENDYNKEVAKKIEEIAKIQSRINQLSLDDSREAQAEKASLEEELAELQGDLTDYQSDYSIEKQQDMLDDMADSYEEEKNSEIEKLKNSISSQEKLYQLAIKRINEDWDGLYDDIINWNYEAGSSIESEIVEAWKLASQAVREYGSYVDAVNKTTNGDDSENLDVGESSQYGDPKAIINQMRSNSLEWWISDSGRQGDLTRKNQNLADQLSSIYRKSIDPKDGFWYVDGSDNPLYSIGQWEAVDYITKAMRNNSAKWNNATAPERAKLESANSRMAGYIASLSGQKVWLDDNGVWWIGNDKLYESYGKYHTGGVVGDSTLKQDEVMAVLEKGELVLDKQREDGLYKIVDFAQILSERLGKTIDTSNFNNLFGGFTLMPASKDLLPLTKSGISSIEFSPNIEVNIHHNGEMTDNDAKRYGNIAAESALSELRGAFAKRGITNIGNASLK